MSNSISFVTSISVPNSNRHHVHFSSDITSVPLKFINCSPSSGAPGILSPASSNATTLLYSNNAITKENKLAYKTINPFTSIETKHQHKRINNKKTRKPKNPIIIIPGYGATAKSYEEMYNSLLSIYGNDIHVCIIPLKISDWGKTLGGRPVTNILKIIDDTVQDVLNKTNSNKVTLLAHSAGGWISRIYLGDIPYPNNHQGQIWNGKRFVNQLICLGTPHKSSEPVTKNNMNFVNLHYPNAHFSNHDIDYINFAGDAVTIPPSHSALWQFWKPNWMARLSYKLTDTDITEDVHVEGDGIVPLSVTFLKGALNFRLNGVWHSADSKGPWYGNENVVRYWSRFLK